MGTMPLVHIGLHQTYLTVHRSQPLSGQEMDKLCSILRALARCWRSDTAPSLDTADAVVHVTSPTTGKRKVLVPEIFTKGYAKVIPHDVAAKEAVCLTSDIAVLGHASIKGDTCITGNVLIAGNLQAAGGICVTGDAVVLGGAHLEGQVTVTGDAFVGGDLAVRGKLEVGGKVCVFGSKDIQPQR